jgi:hypothetical protein
MANNVLVESDMKVIGQQPPAAGLTRVKIGECYVVLGPAMGTVPQQVALWKGEEHFAFLLSPKRIEYLHPDLIRYDPLIPLLTFPHFEEVMSLEKPLAVPSKIKIDEKVLGVKHEDRLYFLYLGDVQERTSLVDSKDIVVTDDLITAFGPDPFFAYPVQAIEVSPPPMEMFPPCPAVEEKRAKDLQPKVENDANGPSGKKKARKGKIQMAISKLAKKLEKVDFAEVTPDGAVLVKLTDESDAYVVFTQQGDLDLQDAPTPCKIPTPIKSYVFSDHTLFPKERIESLLEALK